MDHASLTTHKLALFTAAKKTEPFKECSPVGNAKTFKEEDPVYRYDFERFRASTDNSARAPSAAPFDEASFLSRDDLAKFCKNYTVVDDSESSDDDIDLE